VAICKIFEYITNSIT